jgi:uncharacterized protein (DUF952 family)
MNYIFHITDTQKWAQAQKIGTYQSDSLAIEGFIHCSTLAQVIDSANRFFQGRANLIILSIDPDRVKSKIINEGNPNNLFPHIYGELNTDAVTKITLLPARADGLFSLPIDLKNQDE